MFIKNMFWILILLVNCLVEGNYVYSEDGKCVVDGVDGTCVPVGECPEVVELLKRMDKSKEPQICSFEGVATAVCCKKPDAPMAAARLRNNTNRQGEESPCHLRQQQEIQRMKTGVKAIDKCTEYNLKVLYPCVVDSEGRWGQLDRCKSPDDELIIGGGGVDANRFQFRHMALLLYSASLDVICGGSVISERYILTAAHCSSSPTAGPVKVAVTGMLRLSDPDELWRRNKIIRVVNHPGYESPSKYHDIALLETRILLDYYVVPICLHTGEPVDDQRVSATGWGALGFQMAFPNTLQDVPLFPNEQCGAVYGRHRQLKRGFDNRTQVCYGDDGQVRDTCQGDSGGPVQVPTGRCRYSALGVTSFGRACGAAGVPAVYTRVAHYAPWVASVAWPDD